MGPRGQQSPAIVVEPEPGKMPAAQLARTVFEEELLNLGAANPLTAGIRTIFFRKELPVDTRHNVKINREDLASWAAHQ
jgi:hypothetical protein